jgi:hypothetical protein
MAKVLSTIIGLLVLCIAGLGGWLWMEGSQPIDSQSEEGRNYAQSFKSRITGTCIRLVGSRLGSLSEDADVEDTFRDLCKCTADMTYNEFKDQPPIALVSLVHDSKVQARVAERLEECLERAEIPMLGDAEVREDFDFQGE